MAVERRRTVQYERKEWAFDAVKILIFEKIAIKRQATGTWSSHYEYLLAKLMAPTNANPAFTCHGRKAIGTTSGTRQIIQNRLMRWIMEARD